MIYQLLRLLESTAFKNLFLKIVNMSISAGWLILAVLILRIFLKKAPKWINVLLWGIVAVSLISPFNFESALSLIPNTETVPMNIEMDPMPNVDSGITMVNSVINPVIEASFSPPADTVTSANPLQIWIPIYAGLWLFGIVILLSYTVVSYFRLCRRVNTAVLYRDNIFQSENVSSPFVLGILKPKIYLPIGLAGQDLEHVVSHEQAHIQRKDHWWKPAGFLLLTIYWFNPLIWLAYILLCRDIEIACDEKVIKLLDSRQKADYTQALVTCSVNRRTIAACPLAFGEVGVKERVKSVMNYKKPAFWTILISVIVCVVVAVCFLTNPKQDPKEIASTQETAESETTDETADTNETANSEASDETESDDNTEGLMEFQLADLKQGDEYQFGPFPLSTSFYKLEPWDARNKLSSYTQDGNSIYDPSVVQKFVLSREECLLEGKRFSAVYEFLHDELIDIKFDFPSEKNIAEQFESFVAEFTDLFGPESNRIENQETGALTYTWQADKTRLKFSLDYLSDGTKDMTISIGYTEKELDRILAENTKESRELLLTAFKLDQEYQFEGVPWDSSVEEVEAILNGNLKDVTSLAPKDFVIYTFKDVVYVLNGYEATASIEFRPDELVYISFKFWDLEDPKVFFNEIVSAFQGQYGTETEMHENEATGYIGYHWKTETTHLQTNFYGTMVRISLGTPKANA